MGEAGRDALRVGFEGTIKLEFHGAKVSSDAGLFPYRDIDEAAQLTETGAAELFDFRSGSNIQHSTIALLRQSVYSRLAGYEDTNDAERLSVDPVMRHVVGGRAVDRSAASTSQVARFETEVLTDPDNLAALTAIPGQWVDSVYQRRPLKKLILDMDSSVSPTHGQQEGSMYNGHFGCTCYHPLFLFNQDGDVERAMLRHGNVASADDNQVRLQLFVLAYNLGNFLRRFALPASVKHWTLTTLRDKLIKIGAKVVRHARYVTFQLAEVAVPRQLYRAIRERIRRFAATPPRAASARRG